MIISQLNFHGHLTNSSRLKVHCHLLESLRYKEFLLILNLNFPRNLVV